MAEEKYIERETVVLLKLLEAMKDLMAVTESVLEEPSSSQKKILKRKLDIIRTRLPKAAGEIRVVTKRKETKVLSLGNIKEKTKVAY